MDPLPPPPSTAAAVHHHHNYQDSLESSSVSSPTCRQWDDNTLPPPKLRMMCSYGGHIIPRPQDKSLCYMGGETRIVVADRHTSLADLCSRLSTSLLHGRGFSLKYQLPSEDLDSLVSVTTDEDLDNMVEEYDRLNSSNPSSKPLRLRLFLFVTKPETAASMGSLLDDAKSETWFVDALNGAGLLPRGLSDSAAIDNLLEPKDGELQQEQERIYVEPRFATEEESKTVKGSVHDVLQSGLPDSPMVDSTSSFGSSSSSPSMANLPQIKVRVDHVNNQMAGLDEQLSQLNVNHNHVPPPPLNTGGWAVSDEERSDPGAPAGGLRKPPLPLQPVQRRFTGHDPYSLPSPDSKHGGAYALHSPDSIASDSSISSANYHLKPAFGQDPNPSPNRDTTTPPAVTQMYTTTAAAMNYQIPNSAETRQPPPPQLNQDQQQQQQQQQHFYHNHTQPHYIHQPLTNQPPPASPYYPVYAPPPPQMDHQQQYPLYYLPIPQTHPYNPIQMQSNPPDAAAIPATVTSSAATPPLYPAKPAVPLNKPDMVTNSLYGTTAPGMIQIPNNQFQQQYVNLSQMAQSHHPPTPMPATSNGGNYGYEYGHPTQEQVYYTPSQYQTMTPASAILLTQASSAQQPAPESGK